MSGWDVVVVGGGPAGSAVAARLASAGHNVLLLDRDPFPRPKACGECLNPAAVSALGRLGALPAVRAAPHSELSGWSIHTHPHDAFVGMFPRETPGIAISRTLLDRILLDHARECGAEVRTGVRVTGLIEDAAGVVGVRTGVGRENAEIRARLVVGADGLRSIVVRRLGLIRRPPLLRKLALTAHVRGLEGGDPLGHLHLFEWGCIGIADVGGGRSNVTVVLSEPHVRVVSGSRDEFFDLVLSETPFLRSGTRSGAVMATGPFDWPTCSAIAPGAMLVGDAAGYYDPFTGQGIYRALHGAELASTVAGSALASGDVSIRALQPYETARRRAFDPKVRVQAAIERLVSRPRLMRLASRSLSRRPAIAAAVVAVTGDLQPVRSLITPRIVRAAIGW